MGGYGSAVGSSIIPRSIVVTDGSVYVADGGNHGSIKSDANGNFITKWVATLATDSLNSYAVTITSDEQYVTDTYNHRIQKSDAGGNFITTWEATVTTAVQYAPGHHRA